MGLGGWGRQEEGSGGGEAISGLPLGGMLTALTPCIQDVDSRDRRRRELEQPEPQERPEQPEPSTSWWPVSSAEKKRNITLVRAGQAWSGRNEGLGCWSCDRGRWGTWSFRGVGVQEAGLLKGVMARHLDRVDKTVYVTTVKQLLILQVPLWPPSTHSRAGHLTYSQLATQSIPCFTSFCSLSGCIEPMNTCSVLEPCRMVLAARVWRLCSVQCGD